MTERWNIGRTLIRELESRGIKVCLIHAYEKDEDEEYLTTKDIDIALDPKAKGTLDKLITQVAQMYNWRPILRIEHNVPYSVSYVLLSFNENKASRLAIDFLIDPWGINPLGLSSCDLLKDLRRVRGWPVPTPEAEVTWRIAKRLMGKSWPSKVVKQIKSLLNEESIHSSTMLNRLLGQRIAKDILLHIKKEKLEELNRRAAHYYRLMRLNIFVHRPWLLPLWTFSMLRLILIRLRKPTGIFVVLMGPDGVGKSALSCLLNEYVESLGHSCKHLHWRPHMLPNIGSLIGKQKNMVSEGNSQIPHLKEAQGSFISLIKFAYYIVDFTIGFFLKIKPLIFRKKVILIERYYYDFFVDRLRYRLKLPRWLVSLAKRLVPTPDLAVFLNGSVETILNRKQELGEVELAREMNEFRSLVTKEGEARSINADNSLHKVAVDTFSAITEIFENRFFKTSLSRALDEDIRSFMLLLSDKSKKVAVLGNIPNYIKTALSKMSEHTIIDRYNPLEQSFDGIGLIVTIPQAFSHLKGIFDSVDIPVLVVNQKSFAKTRNTNGEIFYLLCGKGRAFFVKPRSGIRLGTFNPYNPLANAAAGLIKVVPFLVPLLSKFSFTLHNSRNCDLFKKIRQIFGDGTSIASVYTGTPGLEADRKIMLQVVDAEREPLAYLKVANREETIHFIKQEKEVLEYFQEFSFENGRVPRVMHFERDQNLCWLACTPSGTDKRGPSYFTEGHLKFLFELYNMTGATYRLGDSKAWNGLLRRREQFVGNLMPHWKTTSDDAIEFIINDIGSVPLLYVVAHGDFVPWNTKREKDGKLFVFDWEFARFGAPPLYDLLDFTLWKVIIVQKSQPETLISMLRSKKLGDLMKRIASQFGWSEHMPAAIAFYLIDKLLFRAEACIKSKILPELDFPARTYAILLEKFLLFVR